MNSVVLKSIGENYKDEEIKALRANIEFSGIEKKVIMFTSSMPGEGKSQISFDVACSLVESGKNVLFIDADMRKSVLRGRLKANNVSYGLSHVLSGRCEYKEALYSTQLEKLSMIFAGIVPPNPAELLGQFRFEKIIEVTRKYYDYIIIDCPPLGSVIDAAIIAKHCDAAILVIAAGKVSYRFTQGVVNQLKATGVSILGTVLNMVDSKTNKYYGKYYGKYGNY